MSFRYATLVCGLCLLAFGDYSFEMPANITALKVADNKVLVGMDNGELVSYKDNELTTIAKLPRISNNFDKDINSRIYQIDVFNGMSASIAEGDGLKKLVLITKDGKNEIIESPIHLLKQVLILDNNTLLLIGPNCEVSFYDIAKKQITHTSKWTISGFEKAIFSTDRKTLLISCEGGIVFYYDLGAKKLIKEEPLHKDRIYDIATYESRLLTGTPERKARYFNGEQASWYDARFPVYKVALNQNYGAYTKESSIVILNQKGEQIKEISYTGTLLTDLEFLNENELVGAGYDRQLHFWDVK